MHKSVALLASLFCLVVGLAVAHAEPGPQADGISAEDPDAWEVLALQYGVSSYPLKLLVDGEDSGEKHPMGWYFWLLRRDDALVLVDSGFQDAKTAKRRGIREFHTAVEMLATIDIAPEDIDHLVLTHAHWDHAGGVDQFPNATVWIRGQELKFLARRVKKGSAKRAGMRDEDLEAIEAIDSTRLQVMDKGEIEILPGIVAYDEGMHTVGSQWLAVDVGGTTVVLASDNAYLYRNIEEPVAVGTAVSKSGNLEAIEEMRATASDIGLIVPGHDPEVGERFPEVVPSVYKVAGEQL